MHRESEKQFLQAYDDYADAIFRHIALRLGDRERGRELMQDTFMKTWEYLLSGKSVQNIRAFLYRTANNVIIDTARRQKLRTVESLEKLQEEQGFEPAAEADDSVNCRLDARFVMATLQSIDEPLRDVLIMRFVDGLAPAEIAKLLGVSANVVSVRIHRALATLRLRLHYET